MTSTLSYLKAIRDNIKKRWIIILLASAIVFGLCYFYKKSFEGKYTTYSKIFPLSFNAGSSSSPMDAIKAQLGMSDKTDLDKMYNIPELLKSRNISMKVVLQKPSLNKKYKTLADWMIDDYNSHLPMFKKGIKVTRKDSVDYFFTATGLLLENAKVESEKSNFYNLQTMAYTKELAKELNEAILNQLSALYISLNTEKPRTDLLKIQVMRDSLNAELNAVERAIAGFRDENQFASKYSVGLPQAKLLRTKAEIEAIYTTTVSAYQNAKFKLLSQSPIFQVLDKPGEPYGFERDSALKFALIFGLITFIILCLWFSRKVFIQMIVEELSQA